MIKNNTKKGVVLVTVIGIMLVVFTLVLVSLHLMRQSATITEGKIRRIRAYYAAHAGLLLALEDLRNTGNCSNIYSGIGNAIEGYPSGGFSAVVTNTTDSPISGITRLDSTVIY